MADGIPIRLNYQPRYQLLIGHVRRRPYQSECTRSLLTSDVNLIRARLVPGWGTAWEVLEMPTACWIPYVRRRPYQSECTGSLLTSEVNLIRAWLVLGWGTAWEVLEVLTAC